MLAYVPEYAEVMPVLPATESRIFDTQVSLGYHWRNQAILLGTAKVEGTADNEMGVAGQFRSERWLLGGSFWRMKAPVAVSGLPANYNPALSPEINEVRLRAGRIWSGNNWEIAPGLALLGQEITPNSGGIPYTGTPLDFTHYRRGIGIELPAGVSFFERMELQSRFGFFPLVSARLDKAPYALRDHSLTLLEAHAALRYSFLPGLDGELAITLASWLGTVDLPAKRDQSFRDFSSTFALSLLYRPQRVAR
ncbi:MAG: hypothetical protein HY692_10020 [Cyanobacteria bacterium NC_groundwater_1444_Ag_S-0.65um_54_12]|nr:hypothetical protein [Cyanobacteria bacterium NC_groundwater_1444_Ag_S-0.65um_54_12]